MDSGNLHWKPHELPEYVGQTPLINLLAVEITASIKEQRAMHHMVFHGPGGLGKTILTNIIADARGVGPAISTPGAAFTHEKATEVIGRLGSTRDVDNQGHEIWLNPKGYDQSTGAVTDPSIAPYPILVVEEAESVPTPIWEILHSVLETDSSGKRTMMGKEVLGGHVTMGNFWVAHCTIILLTNFYGTLMKRAPATLTRFPIKYSFKFFNSAEMAKVITQYTEKIEMTIDPDAVEVIAARSLGTPRAAVNYVALAAGFAGSNKHITTFAAMKMFEVYGVDKNGLDRDQIDYLKALINAGGGPLGVEALAGNLSTPKETLERATEPNLLRRGYVIRAGGGRVITSAGRVAVAGASAASPLSSRAIR